MFEIFGDFSIPKKGPIVVVPTNTKQDFWSLLDSQALVFINILIIFTGFPFILFQEVRNVKTLPKALRTQALTALTSNFGLVGLV